MKHANTRKVSACFLRLHVCDVIQFRDDHARMRIKGHLVSLARLRRILYGESTKHGPLVHGPPPWTGSMDRVHQHMDRVHGPPFMDRVHGPPYHGPGPWTPYFYK